MTMPRVGVVMGSDSDLPTMRAAAEGLEELGIPHEMRVVSAHRQPHEMLEYAVTAKDRGLEVIIAGAGGAAHLPGMLASATTLPVIGVPIATTQLAGMDSLLSIAQMPRGIPVATTAIGGAANAAILAARILAISDDEIADRLLAHRDRLEAKAREADRKLNGDGTNTPPQQTTAIPPDDSAPDREPTERQRLLRAFATLLDHGIDARPADRSLAPRACIPSPSTPAEAEDAYIYWSREDESCFGPSGELQSSLPLRYAGTGVMTAARAALSAQGLSTRPGARDGVLLVEATRTVAGIVATPAAEEVTSL